jgi:polyketide synthase 5
VATATTTGLPVRGVLHAAVFENAMLTNITDELIEHDWSPKVHGLFVIQSALTSACSAPLCSSERIR